MSRAKVSIVLMCLLASTLVAYGVTAPQQDLTVGDFMVMVASRVNPDETAERMEPERAVEFLAQAGIEVGRDLDSPLTEEKVAGIFSQFGITLQMADPGALLDQERANLLVQVFGDTLHTHGLNTEGLFLSNRSVGNGKISGPDGTLENLTPADCQKLPRPQPCGGGGQQSCNPCMDCCLNDLDLTGRVCGRLCQKKNLTSSPSEPTP